jgi:hypothetical protein
VVVGGTLGGPTDFGDGKRASFAGGVADAFVAKFDPTLQQCLWVNQYGGTGDDRGAGVAVSQAAANRGAIAAHSRFASIALPLSASRTLNVAYPTSGGYTDGFGVLLNP